MTARRLGEILLDHGWITRADLARALKSQQLVGGRLGTGLLEAEAISEELLGQALAEQLGVPPASIEDLRHVEPDVLALVPRRLAVRCRAIPLHAAGSRLDLATADPGNLACQDEIAFATSRRLVVRVASEARIVEALGRYYDERPAGRFVGLVDRLNRQRDAWRAAAAGGQGGDGDRELLGQIDAGEGGAAAVGGAKGGRERERAGGRAAGGEAAAAAGAAGSGSGAAGGGGRRAAAAGGAAGGGTRYDGAEEAGAGAAAEAPAAEAGGIAWRRPVRPAAVTLSETERAALLGAGGAPAAPPPAATPPAPATEPPLPGRSAEIPASPPGTAATPAAGRAAAGPAPSGRPAAPTAPGRSETPPAPAAEPFLPGPPAEVSGSPPPPAGASPAPPPAAAAGPRAVAAPPRREPTTIAVAVAQLGEAVERDEVGRIVVGYLRQLFDRVLLLAVRRDGVRGWLGAGDGVDRERLDDLAIPFDRPSVFLNLRQGSPLHLGPLPPMPAHRPLLAVLGGDPPGPCLLLPVQVAGRLAAAIYGDREGAPVGGIDLDGLRRLAEQAGLALERCISLKRKAHSGPAAG